MLDFHTHILPGVDDGSPSTEISAKMLKKAWEQGTEKVVLTPHFYPDRDRPAAFLDRRQQAFAKLQQALAGETDVPEMILGVEVGFFSGMSHSDALKALTVGDTPYILVEMPQTSWTSSMYRELEDIYRLQGLIPVIAHVERYLNPLWPNGILKRLERLPVLIQADGEFFTNLATRRLALHLLKKGAIHLLGSDCHGIRRRPPGLADARHAITRALGEETMNSLIRNGQKILSENASLLHEYKFL